ncbi:MAG: phosphopantetheine-binding protein [Opitutales bacterium]|nr:phosphopantetheine-binding protein [Opitutales bacterium]
MDIKSAESVQEDLKELLKRCPVGTYEAALSFRIEKDATQIEKIVLGIVDRHLEPEQREIFSNCNDTLRMYDDLGLDSLTMLEIIMMVEQTLDVSIDNEELRDLRTLGDVKSYLSAKARGEDPPIQSKSYRIEEIAAIMPHREPFLFLDSVSIDGTEALATYRIKGNEYFLEGHFKENPVFPASIMIEALGQVCVFFLLKGESPSLASKVDPETIFFTSCDGVKCRRICKPGDVLKMKVKVSRIRHPLACFQGEILVGNDRTAHAEEIKLAFDYYPVFDSSVESNSGNTYTNGNGIYSNQNGKSTSNGNLDQEEIPKRFVKFDPNS